MAMDQSAACLRLRSLSLTVWERDGDLRVASNLLPDFPYLPSRPPTPGLSG